MKWVSNTGLSESAINTIVEVITKKTNTRFIKIFGSRAKGNYKKYSDVDVVIDAKMTDFAAHEIKEELEDKLVYFFDVLVYDNINNQPLGSILIGLA